jgi:DNA/RNA-binding domain of Phe-tRNA-synthetase-like protein
MTNFQYHPGILSQYPHLNGGVILSSNLKNGPTPAELNEAFVEEQQQVLARIGNRPLSELEPLAAWRKAFRGFGVNPTKYRSAVEALLRRLTKKGDIPSINALVDISNLVSIRYMIPVAAFDTQALSGPVTVHFADGSERFTPLFKDEVEHPQPGEVIFSDETGLVIARRWCWRQSDESAANRSTTSAIHTVEAQHPGGRADVESALEDLLELLSIYAGAKTTSAMLGPDNPKISS